MSETALVVLLGGLLLLVVGGVTWWWAVRWRRAVMTDVGLDLLPRGEGRRRLAQARRGPVPADPDERARMAAQVDRLVAARRRLLRWVTPVMAGLALLQAVVLVLDPGILRASQVALPLLLVVLQRAESRSLRRRRDALAPD